jgi:hypothetical protein
VKVLVTQQIATIYVHAYGGKMRAVVKFAPTVDVVKVQGTFATICRPQHGTQPSVTLGFLDTGETVVVGRTGRQTSAQVLDKAKSLVTAMGYGPKIVAPPQ